MGLKWIWYDFFQWNMNTMKKGIREMIAILWSHQIEIQLNVYFDELPYVRIRNSIKTTEQKTECLTKFEQWDREQKIKRKWNGGSETKSWLNSFNAPLVSNITQKHCRCLLAFCRSFALVRFTFHLSNSSAVWHVFGAPKKKTVYIFNVSSFIALGELMKMLNAE